MRRSHGSTKRFAADSRSTSYRHRSSCRGCAARCRLDPWGDGPGALVALAARVPGEQLGALLDLARIDTGADARARVGTAILTNHDRLIARMLAAVAERASA